MSCCSSEQVKLYMNQTSNITEYKILSVPFIWSFNFNKHFVTGKRNICCDLCFTLPQAPEPTCLNLSVLVHLSYLVLSHFH